MAARSVRKQVGHPFPVVYEALVNTLPVHGYEIRALETAEGRIVADHGWSRWSFGEIVTIHVGTDDATTTSVVLDSSIKTFGFARRAHERNFERIFAALDHYLSYYYGRV